MFDFIKPKKKNQRYDCELKVATNSNHKIESFKSFGKNVPYLRGDRVKITGVFGKDIVITGYKKCIGKYNKSYYVVVQFYFVDDANKNLRTFTTSSNQIVQGLDIYSYKIPFSTTLVKDGNYYAFS